MRQIENDASLVTPAQHRKRRFESCWESISEMIPNAAAALPLFYTRGDRRTQLFMTNESICVSTAVLLSLVMMVIVLALDLGDISNVFQTAWSYSRNNDLISRFNMADLHLLNIG